MAIPKTKQQDLKLWTTPKGKEILPPNERVERALKTEVSERGFLDPAQFGIYSALCTHIDFVVGDVGILGRAMAEALPGDPILFPGQCTCHWCKSATQYRDQLMTRLAQFLEEKYSLKPDSTGGMSQKELVGALMNYALRAPEHKATAFILLRGLMKTSAIVAVLFLEGYLDLEEMVFVMLSGLNSNSAEAGQTGDALIKVAEFLSCFEPAGTGWGLPEFDAVNGPIELFAVDGTQVPVAMIEQGLMVRHIAETGVPGIANIMSIGMGFSAVARAFAAVALGKPFEGGEKAFTLTPKKDGGMTVVFRAHRDANEHVVEFDQKGKAAWLKLFRHCLDTGPMAGIAVD